MRPTVRSPLLRRLRGVARVPVLLHQLDEGGSHLTSHRLDRGRGHRPEGDARALRVDRQRRLVGRDDEPGPFDEELAELDAVVEGLGPSVAVLVVQSEDAPEPDPGVESALHARPVHRDPPGSELLVQVDHGVAEGLALGVDAVPGADVAAVLDHGEHDPLAERVGGAVERRHVSDAALAQREVGHDHDVEAEAATAVLRPAHRHRRVAGRPLGDVLRRRVALQHGRRPEEAAVLAHEVFRGVDVVLVDHELVLEDLEGEVHHHVPGHAPPRRVVGVAEQQEDDVGVVAGLVQLLRLGDTTVALDGDEAVVAEHLVRDVLVRPPGLHRGGGLRARELDEAGRGLLPGLAEVGVGGIGIVGSLGRGLGSLGRIALLGPELLHRLLRGVHGDGRIGTAAVRAVDVVAYAETQHLLEVGLDADHHLLQARHGPVLEVHDVVEVDPGRGERVEVEDLVPGGVERHEHFADGRPVEAVTDAGVDALQTVVGQQVRTLARPRLVEQADGVDGRFGGRDDAGVAAVLDGVAQVEDLILLVEGRLREQGDEEAAGAVGRRGEFGHVGLVLVVGVEGLGVATGGAHVVFPEIRRWIRSL